MGRSRRSPRRPASSTETELYGLGSVWADVDDDGRLDLYVANDATPNLLFVNKGGGVFEELGFASGLAVGGDGQEQASMGVDVADYDNDGRLDAYCTHFAADYSTLYHNDGDLFFRDVTTRAQIQTPELPYVSWGTRFVDLNHDGWKDIFHANGHVYPFMEERPGGRGALPAAPHALPEPEGRHVPRRLAPWPAPASASPRWAGVSLSPTSTTTATSTSSSPC